MRVFGLVGWSGSGKTQLIARLLPELKRRGLTVSTVKHAHHAFDIDRPGKDSYVHREAGAQEVMLASSSRWALMHEHRGAVEPELEALARHMTQVDLLLVEGFKRHQHPKLEIHRPSVGKPLFCLEDKGVLAVASDVPVPGLPVPRIDLADIVAIADFVVAQARPLAG